MPSPGDSFVDYTASILGVLLPPSDGWIEDAWRTVGEIWDGRRLTLRPWFGFPAVRSLVIKSPAHAREIKGFSNVRPFTSFLVTTAIGRKPGERKPRTTVAVTPFEPDPEKWAALGWRFAESGELVSFEALDTDGVQWRLRTLLDFLTRFAQQPIPEMLAPDGSPCGPFTRGVLQRRPVRDGERWLVLKEAALYGDDPQHAFSVPPPEVVRHRAVADQDGGSVCESKIKPALSIIGPAAVARRMGLATRTGRAWAAGERQPANPREVAQAIVDEAHQAGLGLPSDAHLRPEDICAELPGRVAAVQCFISVVVAMAAERFGGIRALARAMTRDNEADLEPSLRRWSDLYEGEQRPIRDLNRIVGRLAKFARDELRQMRRRVDTEPGPAGDRVAITAYLSLLDGAMKPEVLSPEETLVVAVVVILMVLVGLVADARYQLQTRELR